MNSKITALRCCMHMYPSRRTTELEYQCFKLRLVVHVFLIANNLKLLLYNQMNGVTQQGYILYNLVIWNIYVAKIYSNKVKDKKLMIKSQSGDGKPWADSMLQVVKQFHKITSSCVVHSLVWYEYMIGCRWGYKFNIDIHTDMKDWVIYKFEFVNRKSHL